NIIPDNCLEDMMLIALSAIHQPSVNEIGLFYVLFFGALALLELGIELFAVLMFCVTILGKF
ncbi:TPA: hypothetical protein ACHY5U_005659, partial [Escherichia coli]|nr:hypothetical protein [Salmonella enterica]ECH1424343.1 hypothetical protein [Salmonella enterica subsp. enterica serovar Adelaide]EDU0855600.1 hypothetical protein [Salmonella enterica subsp. enterica serovar 4,[5],12:i:-]